MAQLKSQARWAIEQSGAGRGGPDRLRPFRPNRLKQFGVGGNFVEWGGLDRDDGIAAGVFFRIQFHDLAEAVLGGAFLEMFEARRIELDAAG